MTDTECVHVLCKCSYSAVLHDDSLVRDEQFFQWVDDSSQIRLVFVVIKLPLSVQHIMHAHHVILRRPHKHTMLRNDWPTNVIFRCLGQWHRCYTYQIFSYLNFQMKLREKSVSVNLHHVFSAVNTQIQQDHLGTAHS